MFCTPNDVSILTQRETGPMEIMRAQVIIESYIGRVEENVNNVDDLELLRRATAFQVAYMEKNFYTVYDQAGIKQIAQSDGMITLDTANSAPFIAPLAVIALRNLSWRRTRSVKTGSVNSGTSVRKEWKTN